MKVDPLTTTTPKRWADDNNDVVFLGSNDRYKLDGWTFGNQLYISLSFQLNNSLNSLTQSIQLILYIKSTYSKDTSLWQCCNYNTYKTSPSCMMATFLTTCSYSNDATTRISSLPWQSSFILLLVSYHWNLYLGWYTKTPSISYISDIYIKLVVIL